MQPVVCPRLAQPKQFAQDGLQGIGLEIDEQEQQLLLWRVQHPLAAATREPLAGLACQGLVGEVKSFVARRERGQQLLELGKRQPGEGQQLPTIALKFRKRHHEAVLLLFLITSKG